MSVIIPFSEGVKVALARAVGAAMNLGHDRICTRHLLTGLLQNEPSVAATIPGQQGVNPQSLHDIDAVLGPDAGDATKLWQNGRREQRHMGNPAGSFIWYELMTPEPDAIAPFYAAVVGWTITGADPEQSGGMDYRMIGRSDGKFAGGVLRLSADMQQQGARPLWLGYLSTPDVDGQIAAIVAEGGKLQMPATNLPNVGRIAMVTDPQGVPFYLMAPVPPPGVPDATSDVFDRHAPQHVNWNELASPDLAASKAFYSRRFGFEFNESMSMGPMGDYCFIDHHGQRIGAVTQRQDERQPAVWLFYIGVPSIAAATRAIEANGGKVLMGPHEVPTGEWIVIATDPAGAGFGLTGPS